MNVSTPAALTALLAAFVGGGGVGYLLRLRFDISSAKRTRIGIGQRELLSALHELELVIKAGGWIVVKGHPNLDTLDQPYSDLHTALHAHRGALLAERSAKWTVWRGDGAAAVRKIDSILRETRELQYERQQHATYFNPPGRSDVQEVESSARRISDMEAQLVADIGKVKDDIGRLA